MRPGEQDQGGRRVRALSVMQELAGEPTAWLDEKVQGLLWLVRPGDDDEGVALRERPEADRGDPQVNVLAGLRPHRLLEVDADSDHTVVVADVGPRAAVGDDTVAERNQSALGEGREREERGGNVEVGAGESRARGQVPPQGVEEENRERLMAAEEQLVG